METEYWRNMEKCYKSQVPIGRKENVSVIRKRVFCRVNHLPSSYWYCLLISYYAFLFECNFYRNWLISDWWFTIIFLTLHWTSFHVCNYDGCFYAKCSSVSKTYLNGCVVWNSHVHHGSYLLAAYILEKATWHCDTLGWKQTKCCAHKFGQTCCLMFKYRFSILICQSKLNLCSMGIVLL